MGADLGGRALLQRALSPGTIAMMLAAGFLDILNTVVQIGTLAVFAGTAIAALIQIRYLRTSNELDALLRIMEQLRAEALQDAFDYVQSGLETRIADPAYRMELGRRGYVDARRHPEITVCNWFNEVGTLVKNRLIDERTFLDIFARLVRYYWARLSPVVALMRRERGPGQFENFEYLAMLAERWQSLHPNGAYPRNAARLKLVDAWREIDAKLDIEAEPSVDAERDIAAEREIDAEAR
jgi:hypothetical protein